MNPAGLLHLLTSAETVTVPSPLSETGKLCVLGKRFYTDAGKLWQWRGVSMFLLFARYLRGEDITPQLRWMQSLGANVARVFGSVPWGGEFEFFRTPTSTWLPTLDAFFTLLEAHGLRCEFVPLTYRHDMAAMRWYVQNVYNIAADHWGVMVETGNEPGPGVNNIDVVQVMRGLNPHNVLSSYGIYDQPGGPSQPWGPMAHLDYVTAHSPRDSHWPRNAKDLLEIQSALNCPVIGDEPWGAGEHDTDGGGSRRTQIGDFRAYFGIAHLFCAGATYHSQAGLEGRLPSAAEPIQRAIADTIRDVWRFIPADAQVGAYRAPHLAGFPVEYQAYYSQDGHAYASIRDYVGFVVFPRPTFSSVTGVNGWRQTAHLSNEIYRIER